MSETRKVFITVKTYPTLNFRIGFVTIQAKKAR